MIHEPKRKSSLNPVDLPRVSNVGGKTRENVEDLGSVLEEAFSVAESILENPGRAQEVVEEAVLEMTNSEPKSLDHPDFELRLMRNVAQRGINLLAEQYQESDRPEEQHPPPGAVEVDSLHYNEQRVSDIRDAVDLLPPLHRAVVRLHYVAGFSFDDITHLTLIPGRNARMLMAEAYKILMSSCTTGSVGFSGSVVPRSQFPHRESPPSSHADDRDLRHCG
jgi:DNA-directed RNA polymerase specialized sigma24 family protein